MTISEMPDSAFTLVTPPWKLGFQSNSAAGGYLKFCCSSFDPELHLEVTRLRKVCWKMCRYWSPIHLPIRSLTKLNSLRWWFFFVRKIRGRGLCPVLGPEIWLTQVAANFQQIRTNSVRNKTYPHALSWTRMWFVTCLNGECPLTLTLSNERGFQPQVLFSKYFKSRSFLP